MLQFQRALRTKDGPPDAARRLGDALKTGFLALGAALKSHGGLFQRRLDILSFNRKKTELIIDRSNEGVGISEAVLGYQHIYLLITNSTLYVRKDRYFLRKGDGARLNKQVNIPPPGRIILAGTEQVYDCFGIALTNLL